MPASRKPDFFIVGAPKCGTTALAEYLESHPDIFMAKKELHYFGSDLQFGPQFYRRDLNAYLAEFNGWHGQARSGEASVWYLFSSQAAREIKAFNSQARIIILLREPASMLYSLYHQFLCDGNEHLPSFREALEAEKDRSAGRRVKRQAYLVQGLVYRATARYTEQVRRYFDVFGRERVHVILYDDLASNTAGVYSDTLSFLGISHQPGKVDFKVHNPASTVRSPFVRNILNHPLLRGTAIAMRSWLPQPLFTAIQNTGTKLSSLNSRPQKREPIPANLDHSLRAEFAPEVERLSALLGRDLTHWSKPRPPGKAAVHSVGISEEKLNGSLNQKSGYGLDPIQQPASSKASG